jgi:hypothetical protein
MVTGAALQKIELHHAVRDGRPPIPLSPEGHRIIEESNNGAAEAPHLKALRALKAEGTWSWKMLRDGCNSQLGTDVILRAKSSLSSARSYAVKARTITGLSFEQLIELLDENELGL